MCEKCDDIITYAGSGPHLRPDRIEPGATYFGKSLLVRPLSLPEQQTLAPTEYSLIHLAVCLTTGPKPLPKRALHIVRSRASSFR